MISNKHDRLYIVYTISSFCANTNTKYYYLDFFLQDEKMIASYERIISPMRFIGAPCTSDAVGGRGWTREVRARLIGLPTVPLDPVSKMSSGYITCMGLQRENCECVGDDDVMLSQWIFAGLKAKPMRNRYGVL